MTKVKPTSNQVRPFSWRLRLLALAGLLAIALSAAAVYVGNQWYSSPIEVRSYGSTMGWSEYNGDGTTHAIAEGSSEKFLDLSIGYPKIAEKTEVAGTFFSPELREVATGDRAPFAFRPEHSILFPKVRLGFRLGGLPGVTPIQLVGFDQRTHVGLISSANPDVRGAHVVFDAAVKCWHPAPLRLFLDLGDGENQFTRIVFDLERIPGMPEENQKLTNLFDAKVPFARFSSRYELAVLAQGTVQLYHTVGPPSQRSSRSLEFHDKCMGDILRGYEQLSGLRIYTDLFHEQIRFSHGSWSTQFLGNHKTRMR